MRDIMNLLEVTTTSIDERFGGIEPMVSAQDIYHNGSAADLRALLKSIDADPEGGAVRGLLIDGELYFWDANLGTHNAVRGGRQGIAIFLNARNVMVDDNTMRFSAPDGAAQMIRDNRHLQAIYGPNIRIKVRTDADEA